MDRAGAVKKLAPLAAGYRNARRTKRLRSARLTKREESKENNKIA
jgi:hypothetical protein